MAKQIALFNHKGGVSKTTTTFNLGWMLAEKGQRVIIVDCDPQCNLTGMVLGDVESIYEGPGIKNIRDGLAPAFESRPAKIEPVVCQQINGQPNMFLLPGHLGLAEYEVTLGIAQELSSTLVTLQNLPGSLRYLFDVTAARYSADLVLVDMSPSLGAINQNLLMTSDYFIIPMAPDYFSVMAIESLAAILPRWGNWASLARSNALLQKAAYPFPLNSPKLLGTIIQKFRLRETGVPSQAFQTWIDKINQHTLEKLVPALEGAHLLLPRQEYADSGSPLGTPLIQMSDFNSLVALSQKHKAPVFGLTDAQLECIGIVLDGTKKSMQRFREAYSSGADRIIALMQHG